MIYSLIAKNAQRDIEIDVDGDILDMLGVSCMPSTIRMTQEQVDVEYALLWDVRRKLIKYRKKLKKPHNFHSISKIALTGNWPTFDIELQEAKTKGFITYHIMISYDGMLNITSNHNYQDQKQPEVGEPNKIGVTVSLADPNYMKAVVAWLEMVGETYIILRPSFKQKMVNILENLRIL